MASLFCHQLFPYRDFCLPTIPPRIFSSNRGLWLKKTQNLAQSVISVLQPVFIQCSVYRAFSFGRAVIRALCAQTVVMDGKHHKHCAVYCARHNQINYSEESPLRPWGSAARASSVHAAGAWPLWVNIAGSSHYEYFGWAARARVRSFWFCDRWQTSKWIIW